MALSRSKIAFLLLLCGWVPVWSQAFFTKTFIDDPVPPGGMATLQFTLTNSDRDNPVTNVTFTDDLDAMLSGAVAVGLPISDVCGLGSTLNGTSTLTLSGGTLGPSETCTFSVSVQIPAGVSGGSYLNTTSPLGSDQGILEPPASDSLVVAEMTLLDLSFSPASVLDGTSTNLNFSLTNTSASFNATNISFQVNLVPGLPGVGLTGLPLMDPCGTGSSLALVGGFLNFMDGTLMPGETCSFSVQVDVPMGYSTGVYQLSSSAISATVNGMSVNGPSDSATLNVVEGPALTKSFLSSPAPGSTVVLRYALSLPEDSPGATNINFTDDLNAVLSGLTAVGLPATDVCGVGSSLTGTSTVSFANGSLAPGETCTFDVTLLVPAGASYGSYPSTTSDVMSTIDGLAVTSGPASDTLIIPGILFSKSFTDDPVLPGATVTLEYTLSNISTDPATNISFSDPLDSLIPGIASLGLPQNDVCGMGSSVSGAGTIILTGGNLAAGTFCTFSVSLLVPGNAEPGSYLSTTSDLSLDLNGSPVTIGGAADTLVIAPIVQFSKSFLDDPVRPGDTVTLQYSVVNLDPNNALTNIAFTDDFDDLLTGLVATGLPQNDVCGSGSVLSGTGILSLNGGNLAAGGSCTFSVVLQLPSGFAVRGDLLSTTSNLSCTRLGSNFSEAPASDTLLLGRLGFSKSFAGLTTAGGVTTLTFTLTNLDPLVAANNVSFTDDLNSFLTGATALGLPMNNVCGAGSVLSGTSTITLTGGTLAGGASCSFFIDVQIPGNASPGTYLNTTSDIAANFAGFANLSGPATDNLGIEPPPLFAKSFTTNPTIVGGISTLVFTIDNSASALAANNLDFTDNLPAGMVVSTPSNSISTCTGGTLTAVPGSGVISYTGGTVAAGSTCTLMVDVVATTAGSHLNTTGDLTSSSGNSGSAFDTLLVNPAPIFSKSFSPNPATIGVPITLVFTIDNSASTVAATSLAFTDNLPAGLSIASPANASVTCTGGTFTALPGTSSIVYSGGSLAAGAMCSLSVDVVAANSGDFLNTSGDLTSSLGNSGPASSNLRVNPPPPFSKSFGPAVIAEGAISTLTFTIDNSGSTAAATGLDFTDLFPAGVVVANPSNAMSTCAGGTLTSAVGSGMISYSGGSVPAGATCTLSVDVTAATAGTYLNTSGDLTSSLGNSGPASDSLQVEAPPLFSKVFGPSQIQVNGTSTLTFTIDNSANSLAANNLAFNDTFPAGLVLATPVNAVVNCTGGTLTAVAGGNSVSYSGGSLAGGASCTLSVNVTAATLGDYVNTSGDLTSSLGNSGPAMAMLRVDMAPSFSKAFSADPIALGQVSTLTFTINNNTGSIAATNLSFTDVLPTGMIVANPANVVNTCAGGTVTATPGSGTISYSGGSVPANGLCTLSVDITTTSVGDFINTSGDLTSSLGNSGPASDSLHVNPQPLFSKSFTVNDIGVGLTTTLTFTIDNSGSTADATGLTFVDNFPPGIAVANPANPIVTCTGGTFNAIPGSALVDYSLGTVMAGGTCTLSVDVVGVSPGAFTNTTGDLTSSLGNSGPASAPIRVSDLPLFYSYFSPDLVLPGEETTLFFVIDNLQGFIPFSSLAFSNTLPPGLTITNAIGNDCGGTLVAVTGSNQIDFSGGSVPAGSTCMVMVNVVADGPGVYSNESGDLTSNGGISGNSNAVLNVGVPVPTLGGWGLVGLLVCLIGIGCSYIRRQKPTQP
ncbi:MAG: DUF11 domain-containing protein [Acidobacteria bacterium]|nr:DUF11 domain-containing protein [Acidobacteriota bacterium]